MTYVLKIQLFGKTMQTSVVADSALEAKEIIENRILEKIVWLDLPKESPKSRPKTKLSDMTDDNVVDIFMKMFKQ
jgi:hypothetical protein